MRFVSGAAAGATATLFTYPLERPRAGWRGGRWEDHGPMDCHDWSILEVSCEYLEVPDTATFHTL